MDLGDEAVFLHERFVLLRPIGGVGPDGACRVVLIQDIAQPRSVVGRRVGDRPLADHTVAAVGRDMVLVAEGRDRQVHLRLAVRFGLGLGILHRPAGIAVLLAQLGRLARPVIGNAPSLDRLLLAVGIALARRGDDGGVNDLAGHRQVALLLQHGIEPGEELIHGLGLGQQLPEQPDRLGVRSRVVHAQAHKPHERQAVPDLELRLVIGQVVQRLQHQRLEHQHAVIRRAAALGSIRSLQRLLKPVAQRLEVHHG